MKPINQELTKLLLHRTIYDSLTPLIEFCSSDKKFIEFLELITKSFSIECIFESYATLAHLVNTHPSEEHDITFSPTNLQKSFKRYFLSWDRLSFKRVPFTEWLDLAEEGINLLKILIDENKLEQFKEDQRYRDFMKRFIQRHEDLRLSGKYPDLNELMDD